MRALVAAPAVALGFLTIIPVATGRAPASAYPRAVAFFPLVGLIVGSAVAVLDLALSSRLPASLVAALDLAVLAILTGGLHLDGLADTADGLFVRGDRERRLAVMRESGVGAFAAASVALVLLTQYAALASFPDAERRIALVGATVLSRWALAVALWAHPYARADGLGNAFKSDLGIGDVAMASVIAALIALALAPGALVALAGVGVATMIVGRLASDRLGGLTGDVYGAIAELSFAVALCVRAAA